jgi:hypothetical protein
MIDVEGKIVVTALGKTVNERGIALDELLTAIAVIRQQTR